MNHWRLGDDLERPVALLVELHRVGDRTRLADERRRSPAAARRSSTARLGRDRFGQLVVGRVARAADRPTPSPSLPHVDRPQRAVRLHDRRGPAAPARATRSTSVTSPKVQIIAMPGSLSGSGERVRLHRHAHAEERRDRRRCRRAACSARRPDARRARRTPESAPGRVVSIVDERRRPAARSAMR